jgi:ligand-binding sensor domain-containing protein/signal transduction histidine kinase
MKICIYILLSISYLLLYLAAQNINFEHLSAEQGLSQASVTCIDQDSTGFIWLGTYDGINRYDGYSFKVFKKDPENPNSLSHNFIRSMLVDREGNLWIGTLGGGLNRYNHKKEQFYRYQNNPQNPNSISYNEIYTIFEDGSGTIWIGTWGGGLNKVVYVKQADHTLSNSAGDSIIFVHFRHDPKNPNSLLNDKISSVAEDDNGLLWIGTREGISILDPAKDEFIAYYIHDPQNPHSLSSSNISYVCKDRAGNIWIGTWGEGLNKYNPDQKRFQRYMHNPDDPYSISHNTIMKLFSDRFGNLWIATWGGGLNRLPPANKKSKKTGEKFIQYQHHSEDQQNIAGNSIYDIFEDRCGVLWFGTDWNGLSKYDPENIRLTHFRSDPNSPNRLNDNIIFALHKDRYNILWIGTRSGGLNALNHRTGKYTHFLYNPDDPHSLSHNTVRAICEDHSGNLWIGTESGLNQYDRINRRFIRYFLNPADPSTTNIYSLYEDKDGYIWLGTWGSGLSRFNPKTKKFITFKYNPNDPASISDNIIWCITEDIQGQLLIGTDHGGLSRFDKKTNQFIHYLHNEKDTNSLSDNKILSILTSKSGDIWIGTTTGLNQLIYNYDPETTLVFKHYTVDNGLFSNTIQCIREDDHGTLWICNGDYLVTLNPETKKIRGYNAYSRLQVGEFSVNAAYKDPKTGEMYLGGINGFNVFHPDSIRENLTIPSVVITDFKLFNKTVPIGSKIKGRVLLKKSITETDMITLTHKDDIFSIEFAALHFNSPQNNQYAYRLEGFEEEWNYVNSEQRTVSYTNMDPGSYTFRVKGSNNDGIWNEKGSSLKIIIAPPFWQTWWFRILSIILIGVLIITSFNIRTNRIRKHNMELEKHVSQRTAELETTNKELEAFTYSVSHDLRAPLRGMSGFCTLLLEDYSKILDRQGKNYLNRINMAAENMGHLIDDLLKLSRLVRSELKFEIVNLSALAQTVVEELTQANPKRDIKITIADNLYVKGDPSLLQIVLRNLFDNAWKFTSKNAKASIEFGKTNYKNKPVFFIKDNGIGIDMKYSDKLFEPFQRQQTEFEGTGVGLATIKRIIQKHGGKIWAEGKVNKKAIFYFTLG